MKSLGVERVVLARECSKKDMEDIISTGIDTEVFIHGAMCISYSGRCLLSNYMVGRDANQGACTHPCRWKYSIVEENMVLDDGKFYPMFRVINGQSQEYHAIELCYGKLLLEQKNAVLKNFLEKEKAVKELILSNLEQSFGEHIETRRKEIQEELEGIEYALQRYY